MKVVVHQTQHKEDLVLLTGQTTNSENGIYEVVMLTYPHPTLFTK